MPSRGPTPVGQSLLWALQTLASRPEPAKLLFLLTDGVFDAGEYRGEVEALAMAGIELATLVLCDPDLPEAEIGPRNAIGSETRFVRSIDEIPEAIHGLLLGLKKRDAF